MTSEWTLDRDKDCREILRKTEWPEKITVAFIFGLLKIAWKLGWEDGIGQRRRVK